MFKSKNITGFSRIQVAMGTVDYRNPKHIIYGDFTCHPNYDESVIDWDYSVITLEQSIAEDKDVKALFQ